MSAHHSAPAGATIIGFGAGALDVFRTPGDVGTDHREGGKAPWTDQEDALLPNLLAGSGERHIGGNVVNALAYLAVEGTGVDSVGMASALGFDDTASTAIRTHLPRVRIGDHTLTRDGYLPSVSIIESKGQGSDRMVRGRPRTPLDAFVSDEYIRDVSAGADTVVVASLKSHTLARRVFAGTPAAAFLSYNPGSSEFRDHPQELQNVMSDRPPDLLALNDEELQQLFGDKETALARLAERASKLSKYVLCTLGQDGVLLAHNGDTMHQPIFPVDPSRVTDTLGAGDRAHAVAIDGLTNGRQPAHILEEVVASTAQVIQHRGAHADLYA